MSKTSQRKLNARQNRERKERKPIPQVVKPEDYAAAQQAITIPASQVYLPAGWHCGRVSSFAAHGKEGAWLTFELDLLRVDGKPFTIMKVISIDAIYSRRDQFFYDLMCRVAIEELMDGKWWAWLTVNWHPLIHLSDFQRDRPNPMVRGAVKLLFAQRGLE